jgi:hypothetical protein
MLEKVRLLLTSDPDPMVVSNCMSVIVKVLQGGLRSADCMLQLLTKRPSSRGLHNMASCAALLISADLESFTCGYPL